MLYPAKVIDATGLPGAVACKVRPVDPAAPWPSCQSSAKSEGVTPKIHFSSARLDGREVRRGGTRRIEPPLLRQHADFVDPWTFAELLDEIRDLECDVMIEAKAKDLAVLKLRSDLEVIGRSEVLGVPGRG